MHRDFNRLRGSILRNRTPPLPAQDELLYDHGMKRKKRPSGAGIPALWLFGGMLAFSTLLAPPASGDIYRWEDESGVVHFPDDLSAIPLKYKGKAREILKTPPEAGKPSVSTMDAPSPPTGGNGRRSSRAFPPPGSSNRKSVPDRRDARGGVGLPTSRQGSAP